VGDPGRVPRTAARVALLDDADCLFLLRYDDEEIGPHWAMPGGGSDPGETPEETVKRELEEETGWSDLHVGPELWIWEHDFTLREEPPTEPRAGRDPRLALVDAEGDREPG